MLVIETNSISKEKKKKNTVSKIRRKEQFPTYFPYFGSKKSQLGWSLKWPVIYNFYQVRNIISYYFWWSCSTTIQEKEQSAKKVRHLWTSKVFTFKMNAYTQDFYALQLCLKTI